MSKLTLLMRGTGSHPSLSLELQPSATTRSPGKSLCNCHSFTPHSLKVEAQLPDLAFKALSHPESLCFERPAQTNSYTPVKAHSVHHCLREVPLDYSSVQHSIWSQVLRLEYLGPCISPSLCLCFSFPSMQQNPPLKLQSLAKHHLF